MSRKLLPCLFLLALITGLSSCYKEITLYESEPTALLELPVLLQLDGKDCFFDSKLNLLRYSISMDSLADFSPVVKFQHSSEISFQSTQLQNNQVNHLGKIQMGKPYPIVITCHGTEKSVDLIFTNLPIIQLISDAPFYDEPKSLTRIHIEDPHSATVFSSYAGMEIRGGFSRGFDKKSLGFSLWRDMNSTSDYSSPLLGNEQNSDWILNSSIIDPSRIRNLVSIEIWNSLNTTGINSNAHLGVKSQLVEVFINNTFKGIYTFSQKLNKEFLDAREEVVLYKAKEWADGGTTFSGFNPEMSSGSVWNGWEQELPDAKERINWQPLYDLSELVVNGNDEVFIASIEKLIDLDVLTDYYLLLNLTSAFDNEGKNTFLLKENASTPFLMIPWDLDGSWGITYDGSPTGYEAILGNNLYDRLNKMNPLLFREKVKERWLYLRNHQFSKDNLFQHFDLYFRQLNASDIIQQENRVWNLNLDMRQEQDDIEQWISNRLLFLDEYFENY
jgi:hypothetical protein